MQLLVAVVGVVSILSTEFDFTVNRVIFGEHI